MRNPVAQNPIFLASWGGRGREEGEMSVGHWLADAVRNQLIKTFFLS